jgi:hypothetical protein
MKNIPLAIFVLFMMFYASVSSQDFDADFFVSEFSKYDLAMENLRDMKHDFVLNQLHVIAGRSPEITIRQVGTSVEGRSINMLSFGAGPMTLLLWSQMHGDEPTATASLLALFNYLAQNPESEFVKNLHNRLSINAIVMLNPDGAERFQRRNAQDIDINRDARLLQSPEGQTLKKVKEELNPDFGYNLHNMTGREMVGESKKLLNIAFMAPPYNKENEDTPTRIRAKKLVVLMKDILDKFIAGHISIYKADYMPRAFGDAMQNWGVSTVLIESALHDHQDAHFLVKMNFVALLASFDAIAGEKLNQVDASLYDEIPIEGTPLFDLMIRNALIYNGTVIPPFIADIGINIDQNFADDSLENAAFIRDLGDLSIITGGRQEIDAGNLAIMPGLISVNPNADSNEMYKCGITTNYGNTGTSGNKLVIPPGSFPLDPALIGSYTFHLADSLGIKKTGKIMRGQKADLVIFEKTEDDRFDCQQIKFVIKNGKIVYQNP